jgi:hypothetical protein
VNLQALPDLLKAGKYFINWQYGPASNGKPTKLPYDPNYPQRKAKSNDPKTWSIFEKALKVKGANGSKGIGRVLTREDFLKCVDLDHCRNPITGEIEAWAWEIILLLNSYTEISPSGEGVHIWVKVKFKTDVKKRKKGNVELFSWGFYLTMTGDHLENTPTTIKERQGELEELERQIFEDSDGSKDHDDSSPKSTVKLSKEDLLPPDSGGDYSAYAQAALANELAKLECTPETDRNNQLNNSAFALAQFFPRGHLDRGSVEAALYGVAVSIGLTPQETRATIRSGIEAGMKQPRKLPERKPPPAPGTEEPPSDLPWDEQRQMAYLSLGKLLGIAIKDISFARGQNATWEITLSDGFIIALTAAQLASQTACHNKILEGGVSINPVPKAQDGVGGWRRLVVQPFTKYARRIDIGPEQTERGEVRELLETWLLESHTPEFFGKKKVHSNCSFFSIRENSGAPGLYMRFNALMNQAKDKGHKITRAKMSLLLRGLGHEAVKIFHNGIELRAWRLNWATIPETVKFKIIKSANDDDEKNRTDDAFNDGT